MTAPAPTSPQPTCAANSTGVQEGGKLLAKLISVRLLATSKPLTRNRIMKDLDDLFGWRDQRRQESNRKFEIAFDFAQDQGWISGPACPLTGHQKTFQDTPRGIAVAWEFLGCSQASTILDSPTWTQLRNHQLTAAALEIEPSASNLGKLARGEGLFAAVLNCRHHLGLPNCPSKAAALDAFAWRQFTALQSRSSQSTNGVTTTRRFNRGNVLRVLCFDDTPCGNPIAKLASLAVGAANARTETIRRHVIQQWLEKQTRKKSDEMTEFVESNLNLESFANLVNRITSEIGLRDHVDKILIFGVWKTFNTVKPAISRESFDALLLRAAKRHLISLCRADLPETMDRQDVQSSEVRHPTGSGAYHFIRVTS